MKCLISTFLMLVTVGTALAQGETPNQHPFPFQTVQPDGSVITLSYRGDEHFHWYEDAAGYTVVRAAGRYRYATLDEHQRLVPTGLVVGKAIPQNSGLTPGRLPPQAVIDQLRAASEAERPSLLPTADPGIPPGCTLIEGCIVVPTDALQDGDGQDPQNGVHLTVGLWPAGVVPYEFDANVSSANRTLMRDAMESWEAVAGLSFIPRSGEANYVHIFSGTGNWSFVGMIGGRQDISIFNWTYHFIMMHELAHALGVWHEQSRSDRDTYIQVSTGNIQTGFENNFDIQPAAAMEGAYDFDSIMHYGQCAFSNCSCSPSCWTITCLSPNESWQNLIGQRTHLSVGDAENMAAVYSAPGPEIGARMTAPENDGDALNTDAFTFEWDAGVGVAQYRLWVGTTDGGNDLFDYTGTDLSATVTGLPTNGSTTYVRLHSEIDSAWEYQPYSYTVDICPGFDDDLDADGDGVPDGCDVCPEQDDFLDTDADGTPDCLDDCPDDPTTTDAGVCGCGAPEEDLDDDGVPDCIDNCPLDPDKFDLGTCGCGVEDTDTDGDGVADCLDPCPNDPDKLEPGVCGCGEPDLDSDGDGIFDCNEPVADEDGTDEETEDLEESGETKDPLDSVIIPPTGDAGACGVGAGMSSMLALLSICGAGVASRRRRTKRIPAISRSWR